MNKPRLLDLFCGAGGAAMGYHRAGFEVVGVDLAPQKHYPFEFHQADALDYPLEGFDVIHASPPCQHYSSIARYEGVQHLYPDLVAPVRNRISRAGVPWIMENVPGAPLYHWATVCGSAFDLGIPELGWYLRRHRLFESSHLLWSTHCRHKGIAISVTGTGTVASIRDRIGRCVRAEEFRRIMGITWMNRHELSESIPPAYTEWLGRQLISILESGAAA